MYEARFPRNYRIYVALVALVVLLFFLMPRSGNFKQDYRKGSPWMYDNLVAQFDFPVLKTDAQLQAEREALGSDNTPYYRKSAEVYNSARNAVSSADFGANSEVRSSILGWLAAIYDRGVLQTKDIPNTDSYIYVQTDKKAIKYPLSELYTVDEAKAEILAAVSASSPGMNADSLCIAIGVYNFILPDLSFDQKTTDFMRYSSADLISTTEGIKPAGTLIVSTGEVVTAEIEQLLDSYKAEYENSLGYNGPIILLLLANLLMSLIIVAMLFFSILYTNESIFRDTNRFMYILLLFLLSCVGSLVVDRVGPNYLFMVPFTLVAIYMLAFFKKRVVLPVYIVSLLPLLIFAHNGPELFVMYLAAGVLTIYTFAYFNRGWLQFVNAFLIFIVLAVVWMVFQLFEGVASLSDYRVLANLALSAFLCVAGYPLIFLFEKIFRLVSKNRLHELCDTNANKCLIELNQKAPGTFQHSLQVMNMCEAAAKEIGANVELIRAGAMYHDIGKMMNPGCFIENTDGSNRFHEGLTPQESAQHLIRHVSDGLVLAEKYGLPDIIVDYIRTHHGTTRTGYFYGMFLKNGGSPDSPDAAMFSYTGMKPIKKGHVILMLCDSVEAASRTQPDKTKESLEALVDKIIDGKISEGQLVDSDITMKELEKVRSVIKKYLIDIYHPRIAYPDAQDAEQKKKRRL
ncbi:MAG: HDIG domain-containing protein [Bacteroidales bacterium]|nr:HDIG domain-containing protein [Bacteroidales bacterium]